MISKYFLDIFLWIFVWVIYQNIIEKFKISKEKEFQLSIIGLIGIVYYLKINKQI